MPETLPTAELHDHPRAELIPPMRSGEYAVLVADIGERGIAVPLDVNSRGEVLDGRHRLRAAGELGLESVPVRVVETEDELAYILRAAINHRHLDASQRAALALELDEHTQRREEAQARRLANLRRGPDVATLPHRGERTPGDRRPQRRRLPPNHPGRRDGAPKRPRPLRAGQAGAAAGPRRRTPSAPRPEGSRRSSLPRSRTVRSS